MKMIFKLFLLPVFSGLTMAACQTADFKTVRAPDGKNAREISCKRYPECYDIAAKVCHQKYEIVPTVGEAKAGAPSILPDVVSILVRCK